MQSFSFDGLAHLYDETRTVDPACLGAALDFLAERFPPARYSRALEPGIGTGRIAIPLAQRGYQVTGIDVSDQMLSVLAERLAQARPPLRVAFQKGDVTDLPFADATFDMVLAVHLFYFVADWRRAADEIARVVRPGGVIVLMHTGTGAEVPGLNERYKQLCAELGCPIRPVGASSTNEVIERYARQGLGAERIGGAWQWTARIRLDEALGYMRARAYAFTAVASDDVHEAAMRALDEGTKSEYGTLSATIEVPKGIRFALIPVP
jgi:ubiquinone/menaquinone biosynthesis C-methylase UbiE